MFAISDLSCIPSIGMHRAEIDPLVYAVFYLPDSSWRWYVTEATLEKGDVIFFGYVVSFETAWTSFSASELDCTYSSTRRSVERKSEFHPVPLSLLLAVQGQE